MLDGQKISSNIFEEKDCNMKKFTELLKRKSDTSKDDSDFSYFFSLLVYGEAITKMIALIIVSALKKDENRHQYRLLYQLVRANGIGEWSKAIDEMLLGTASQYLNEEFRQHQKQLTEKVNDSDWRHDAVSLMVKAAEIFNIDTTNIPQKKDLKTWFRLFSELRNSSRGHGIIPNEKASTAAPYLEKSIELIVVNCSIFQLPFAYLKRNLNGKYRVTPLNDNSDSFNLLKRSDSIHLLDGVYTYIDGYKKIHLIESDPDISDFYLSNGGFGSSKYELRSYYSDCKIFGDSSKYNEPVGRLPGSESEGIGELLLIGNCFTNVPSLTYTYIKRDELERDLYTLLIDDRRTIVTLLGRGGIGKTSLALRVLPCLYDTKKYSGIIWLSSRDVDLSMSGPKIVSADVVSIKEISKYYSKLVLSKEELDAKGFNPIEYFQSQLTKSDIGPCLFVFDNFETTDSPTELFKWLDTFIRQPNKILITTRLREFIGDYPLTVGGMNYDESVDLIKTTWSELGQADDVLIETIEDIIKKSSGHPYIIKIILGALSRDPKVKAVEKIIAGNDEILTALFERTFAAMSPCAQRVYLTLSEWNSAIPRLAVESVLMNSIDDPLEVEKAIDTLLQYSILEEKKSDIDGQYFIGLPYVARSFGQKKTSVSPIKVLICNDAKMLMLFGASKLEEKSLSIEKNVINFLKSTSDTISKFDKNEHILSRICLGFNDVNYLIAEWLFELGDEDALEKSKAYLQNYIQNNRVKNNNYRAWVLLAKIYDLKRQNLEQVHALVEIAQFSDVNFCELSVIANKVNWMFNSGILAVDNNDIKSDLLIKIFQVLWNRKSEGDATDLSRIAWLALHINDKDRAKELVYDGLKLDPCNEYCKKLLMRLEKRAV